MTHVISFRPGVIGNNTAFECMALIYKYLQNKYDYRFTIIKSEEDDFYDPELKIVSIPKKIWGSFPDIPFFPYASTRKKTLEPIFKESDIVLTVDPTRYYQGLLAIRYGNRLNKPVFFDASLTLLGQNKEFLWRLFRPKIKKALYQASGIIVTVPKCIERFNDLCLFDEKIAKKFTVMGHPVDTSNFKPAPKKSNDGILRAIVVSRLVPEKGLYYILEAISPLLKENKKFILQILGSGPMESLLRKEITERNLNSQVEFIKPVVHAELPGVLSAADIFINHMVPDSRSEEAFGAVNIEAMSCGLPSVLSRVGGIPYAIREEGVAILVEPRNIVEIRAAITRLLTDSSLRKEMGEKARAYVKKHYDLEFIAEKYHNMLTGALA